MRKNGYEIIYYEEDGCDDDGPMFWVDCINGWYGREWNVKSSMYNKINNYLNSIDICFIHKIVPEFSMNDKYEALKYYFNTKNRALFAMNFPVLFVRSFFYFFREVWGEDFFFLKGHY